MTILQGKFRAVIIATDDPAKLMRTKIRVNGLMADVPEDSLPWAECMLPSATSFNPFVPGDLVWVEFPYGGDSRRPLIVGFAQDAGTGKPNISAEASGQGDTYKENKVDDAPESTSTTAIKDYVYQRFGLMEVRNAKGGWSMTTTKSGTTLGINDNGDVYVRGATNIFVHSGGNTTLNTEGYVAVKAKGKVSVSAEADCTVTSKADVKVTASGSLSVKSSGSMSLKSGSSMSIKAGGVLTMTASAIRAKQG